MAKKHKKRKQLIAEAVKSFMKQPQRTGDKDSSGVPEQNTLIDLSNNDMYPNTGAFFDDRDNSVGLFGDRAAHEIIFKQKAKIQTYRKLSMVPDVTDAVDEIVNEVIFSYDDQIPVKIDVDDENEKLVDAISEKFDKIVKLISLKRNIFQLVKNSYIDGQIIMHLAYDKKGTKNGIKAIKMVEPCLLYFDKKDGQYKYMAQDTLALQHQAVQQDTYSVEELVREDFGLYDDKVNLGYLEYAVKPANMLKTLEDLLIPLRFSRSISRRVFNVDVGDLPVKRAREVMQDHQRKFKYKKFYNNETGEVSNQQHITSMVEDYWFSNRSGGKGTTVDVLDESGNLGELGDILYFAKKLYRSMKIPSSRISIDPDSDKDYDFETTRVSKEDMKFFMFISRIRQVYSSLFKEILKREVISTGILSESEWDTKEDAISIQFANENKFIEKMKLENFMQKIDIYSTAQDYQGKLFSVQTILKDVFRMSEEEILEEFKAIEDESKNPLYKNFYSGDDDGDSW